MRAAELQASSRAIAVAEDQFDQLPVGRPDSSLCVQLLLRRLRSSRRPPAVDVSVLFTVADHPPITAR